MSDIGIDLDGVCYDFAASVAHFLGVDHPNPQSWEFYADVWGLSLLDFLTVCHRGVDAGVIFSYGDPFPGVRDALESMAHAGHRLHIITDRSFGTNGASEAATRTWLDRHHLPFDSITFSADKTIVKTDYMIDDKVQNYDALDADGCKVYLLDQAWNRRAGHRRRVYSLTEFSEVIA